MVDHYLVREGPSRLEGRQLLSYSNKVVPQAVYRRLWTQKFRSCETVEDEVRIGW